MERDGRGRGRGRFIASFNHLNSFARSDCNCISAEIGSCLFLRRTLSVHSAGSRGCTVSGHWANLYRVSKGARMATDCYGHACWSRVLWLLIYDTRIRETSNNHANAKMPPQKDREDALNRGTYHSWIIQSMQIIWYIYI